MKPFYIKLLSILLISGLGILVYSNSFFCSFHFDDDLHFTHNFAIRNIYNWQNIWNYYHTRFVTFLSLGLNYHLNGLNVFGYHVFNLTVHLLAAFFIWWLVLLTLSTPVMKDDKITRHADAVALLAGLVFVSHPVQIEAVTYIWERCASLVALFYLASLCFYVKSRLLQDTKFFPNTGPLQKFYYFGSLITAVLAMFTKENSVTLPLMILFYEFTFLKTKRSLDWKYIAPFLLTIFIMPITLLLSQSETFQGHHGYLKLSGGEVMTPMHYFLTQFRVMITYIRLVFLPFNQNLDYDYPVFKSFFEFPVLMSFLFLMVIFYWAIRLFSQYRLVSFSIFWFFLTVMVPESSFWVMGDVIFEHRLYLPLAGYSLFLVSGMYYLFGKNSIKTMVMALSLIIACNSVLTYQRNKVWRDEFTLWDDAVRKSPHKTRPYLNRGSAYYNQGQWTQALRDYNRAIAIDPDFAAGYSGRGDVYRREGNFTQALSDYNKAIEIDPQFIGAYFKRADLDAEKGDYAQAILDLSKAIAINPNYAEVYYNRGLLYEKEGRYPQAMSDYNKAITLNPGYADAYNNRGLVYRKQGNLPQAMSDYNKAIDLDPHNPQAYNNRGNIFAQQGNFILSLFDYNEAIRLNPEYGDAYYNRGLLYDKQGNYPRAILDLNKAIVLNPRYLDAYNNRAVSYYQLKEYDKAWADVHKAEALGYPVDPDFIGDLKQASGKDR